MELSPLTAISPIDGRYAAATKELRNFFSEFALIKYRVHVEVEYFIALTEIPLPQLKQLTTDKSLLTKLRTIVENFSKEDAQTIKEIEKKINHDVKAVEYFLKEKFTEYGWDKEKEFIHFGLTSQDINNTAVPLLLKDAMQSIYVPALFKNVDKLKFLADD